MDDVYPEKSSLRAFLGFQKLCSLLQHTSIYDVKIVDKIA